MKSVPFKVSTRTESKSIGSNRLRDAGRVPGVVYGRKTEPRSVEVDEKALDQLIKQSPSANILVDLSVEDEGMGQAFLKEVQVHPVSGRIVHMDLHAVTPDQKVTLSVPINFHGEAKGVKQAGGTLERMLVKTKVKAFPKDLPETIDFDVTEIDAGQTVRLGELVAPEGVELLGKPNVPVLNIRKPRVSAKVEQPQAKGKKK